MKIHINNTDGSTRYLQIHSVPPHDFPEWSEEQKEAWMEKEIEDHPPVIVAAHFKGEIDIPDGKFTTGIEHYHG